MGTDGETDKGVTRRRYLRSVAAVSGAVFLAACGGATPASTPAATAGGAPAGGETAAAPAGVATPAPAGGETAAPTASTAAGAAGTAAPMQNGTAKATIDLWDSQTG